MRSAGRGAKHHVKGEMMDKPVERGPAVVAAVLGVVSSALFGAIAASNPAPKVIDQFVLLVHPCPYEALHRPLTDPYRVLEEAARQRWLRAIPMLSRSTFVVQVDYAQTPNANELHQAFINRLGAGHVTRVSVKVVGPSTPDALREYYREIHRQIRQQIAAQGLTFDPATARPVIWGQSFEGCASGYGSAIASCLGLKTLTRLDYEMSAPDAPFLLKARFVQTVPVPDSDVEAYLFDLNDGRCAAFFRSCLTPQWLDHRPIRLRLDPQVFSVLTKQGATVWPESVPGTAAQSFTLSTVQERFIIATMPHMTKLLSAIRGASVTPEATTREGRPETTRGSDALK